MATLSHKIRLDPTFKQRIYFCKACGVARFTWNWGLAKWNEYYQAGTKKSAFDLKKEFNSKKKEEYPWTYEVTKYASQQPFIYLNKAFQSFFNKKTRYPKFKKKGINDSFYIGGDQLQIEGKYVKIPNLGWVRLTESLRFEGKINGATISRMADRWFISINVETNHKSTRCENQAKVGIDLGITTLATLSNGIKVPNCKPLKKYLTKLKRVQRAQSKKKIGSNNRKKANRKIANLHYKIKCLRSDTLHKLTTSLTENYRYIAIENLDISELLRQKKLSRHIMDCGWYEFRRQLSYKADLRGNKLVIADQWYPSSKGCSACGHYKEELSLAERIYHCTACKIEIDRELNAAIRLEQLIDTASSAGIDVC